MTIQARRFASRSSTRQTNSLNSDKKVNSKPSETGHSPLNRLANRPAILRAAAYLEFYSFYIFRVFFRSVLFRAAFPCAFLFYCRKNHFSLLPEYDFTPRKRQKSTQNLFQPIRAFSSAYDIIVDVTTTSHFDSLTHSFLTSRTFRGIKPSANAMDKAIRTHPYEPRKDRNDGTPTTEKRR